MKLKMDERSEIILEVGSWENDMTIFDRDYLRNEFNFWKVHGIMNTSGLVQSK